MDEQTWLRSKDPVPLLNFLQGITQKHNFPSMVLYDSFSTDSPSRISRRKIRLICCALVRRVWNDLGPEAKIALETAELYADNLATERELHRAWEGAVVAGVEGFNFSAARCADLDNYLHMAPNIICRHLAFDTQLTRHQRQRLIRVSKVEQSNVVREIAGNPFHTVTLPLDLAAGKTRATDFFPEGIPLGRCSWLTPTVVTIARAAYDERGRKCRQCKGKGKVWEFKVNWESDWKPCTACHGTGCVEDGTGCVEDGTLDPERLPILADALLDAGCTDEGILRHLRGQKRCLNRCGPPQHKTYCAACRTGWIPSSCSPHVRGCWVLDLILGKA